MRPSFPARTRKAAAAGSSIAPVPREWELARGPVRFNASLTPFRHLGFFPDMAPQWDWMRERAADADVLNLFGYTGVGSLILSEAGARMVHVDASKKSVEGGKANAALSGLGDRPIRWIVDDASKFTAREVRRERRYDGILLDPPKFGRGPEGEVWRLEENLAPLLADCRRLLDENSRFLVLTVYAVRMSALAIGELVKQVLADLGGKVEVGEMSVREEARGLLLPTAIFARWSRTRSWTPGSPRRSRTVRRRPAAAKPPLRAAIRPIPDHRPLPRRKSAAELRAEEGARQPTPRRVATRLSGPRPSPRGPRAQACRPPGLQASVPTRRVSIRG